MSKRQPYSSKLTGLNHFLAIFFLLLVVFIIIANLVYQNANSMPKFLTNNQTIHSAIVKVNSVTSFLPSYLGMYPLASVLFIFSIIVILRTTVIKKIYLSLITVGYVTIFSLICKFFISNPKAPAFLIVLFVTLIFMLVSQVLLLVLYNNNFEEKKEKKEQQRLKEKKQKEEEKRKARELKIQQKEEEKQNKIKEKEDLKKYKKNIAASDYQYDDEEDIQENSSARVCNKISENNTEDNNEIENNEEKSKTTNNTKKAEENRVPLTQQEGIKATKQEKDQPSQNDEKDSFMYGVGGIQNRGKDIVSIKYVPPSPKMLEDHKSRYPESSEEELDAQMDILISALKSYNINCVPDGYIQGPTVTLFKVIPDVGVKVAKILNLADDIARYLGVSGSAVRIIPTIPGTHAIGIETPNVNRQTVSFKNIIPDLIDDQKLNIPFALGKTITGKSITIDIVKTPHLLIAGATGSGKSVCINSMIASILFKKTPSDVRMIMVDPKVVELQMYNGIPHLLTPVITDPKKAIKALDYAITEMERRYKIIEEVHVRNINGYNEKIKEDSLNREKMPYILFIIDEFADLMTTVGKELESRVARLAAKARAIGIHLVLATQRPSVDVVTGTLKNNLPSRIAFRVPSGNDSRTIIDSIGAEKLLGNGDMLYKAADAQDSQRIQGAFLSDEETERIVEHCKKQGKPLYIDDSWLEDNTPDDEENESSDSSSSWTQNDEILLEKAWEVCIERKSCSTSYIQRRLRIGYNSAARIVEEMEMRGIVSEAQGAKPRQILKYPE